MPSKLPSLRSTPQNCIRDTGRTRCGLSPDGNVGFPKIYLVMSCIQFTHLTLQSVPNFRRRISHARQNPSSNLKGLRKCHLLSKQYNPILALFHHSLDSLRNSVSPIPVPSDMANPYDSLASRYMRYNEGTK
jgi:hypothetical protein